MAGQINGTTGYEEAGAQGLVAGVNAALVVLNKEPFILGRQSYIGVLIDDLVTKGTEEPYRMFTSRVEYRLIVREDNADRRLSKIGHELGLLSDEDYHRVEHKYAMIEKEIEHLRAVKINPGTALDDILASHHTSALTKQTSLYDLLKRPQVSYEMIAAFDGTLKEQGPQVIAQVEYEIKYEGFISRQNKDVEKFKHIEHIRIPAGMNFDDVHGLSKEIREKLKRFGPATLGQANRISGVTPAAITLMMVYLKKLKETSK